MTSILLHDYVDQVDKLIDDNRLVEAIEHCRHILHTYPRHIDTYRVMGKALLEKQEYDAASDLFLRILGADPSDFISHVGLSIIYKEESQNDQALWHLERAYEIQPYNVAIQGELRQLYAIQSEVRPGIIPLTQGALARLYMKGELYQQAISELRRVLAEEPSRVDLQVLLAEALWRDDQRIEAEEVCLNGLEIIPNCIVLNAILAEIWLQTGRIPEAQKYLYRLHALTQETKKTVDNETIPGRAFVSEGAFPLPEDASLDFLQTGTIVPSEPEAPADDWVGEVSFDAPPLDQDALDAIVLEPESGMHSYDWLADIDSLAEGDGTAVADQVDSDTDWFSDDSAKEALKLTTSELSAEWLADLRGDEEIELPDLNFEDTDSDNSGSLEEPATAVDETDWFAEIEETADDASPALETEADSAESPDWLATLADNAEPIEIDATGLMEDTDSLEQLTASDDETDWFADAEETADDTMPTLEANTEDGGAGEIATDESPDWLAALADKDEPLEIDATSLMDEDLGDWAEESEPHVVEEPKTPFWLSEMAGQEMDAVQLNPDEALDWLTEPEDEPAVTMELESQDDMLADEELAPTTAVLDEADQSEEIPEDAVLDTDSLGDADDWLAALIEGELDEELLLSEAAVEDTASDEITLEASTDELAALSDADDWLQTAAADLDTLLEEDEEEFPNLAIPELQPSEISDIPDWLTNDPPTLSEESEATVSSENDPQEVPQPEEPEVGSAQSPQSDTADDAAFDWLDNLTSDTDGEAALQAPPIETEGMPSWLDDANDEDGVEVVDEWDSASAEIPDWLQEPVELADLDEEDLLTEVQSDAPGLTSLLSEMDVEEEPDEAVSLDEMDSLFFDWEDDSEAGGLTGLLDGIEIEDEGEPSLAKESAEPEKVPTDLPDSTDELEEVGLTGLLSNLTLEADETAVPGDDSLADILDETADDEFADLFAEDAPLEISEDDDAIGLGDLDEELSLTELLADIPDEEDTVTPDFSADSDDDWFTDLAELAEDDAQPEAEVEEDEATGLTGLLANLDVDEEIVAPDSTLSETDDDLPELDDQPAEEMGLTELLAGIDYEEDAVASEFNFDDVDYQPVEPSLTEVLSEMAVEPEPEPEVEELPVSAEDTTWLNQLEAETGDLQDQVDEFDMAEETGLDWLTEPEEPTAVAEEVEPETLEEDEPVVIEEPDSSPEDWDDAMSWLEELAAQQDDPVGELPSVAENVLDEELEDDELAVTAKMDSPGTDWLADLTGGEEGLELDDLVAGDDTQPDLPETVVMTEEQTTPEPDEDEMSWLDDLATDKLDASLIDEVHTAVELDELLDAPEPDTEVDETTVAVDIDPVSMDEEDLIVTGVTDALKEDSGIEEAEADLEEALAWLDDLDGEAEIDVAVEPPTTPVELTVDIPDEEAEPETVVVQPEPDELTMALDRLEMRVHKEGIAVPETAVLPLTLSNEELHAALDWIEQAEAEPVKEAMEAIEEEPDVVPLEEVVANGEVTAVAEDEDVLDLSEMSDDDPEAWLEQLLSDDLQMDVEMEPPPIKPSEDAVFVTDDRPTQAAEEPTSDGLLDDLEIDDVPDDPDAAVAWLEEQVDESETAVEEPADDEIGLDELADPEAWLEEMLSGDMALDVDMEPPPIKPSEDAVYVTDDAELDTAETSDVDLGTKDVAVDVADEAAELVMGDLEEDPEAWLEEMLSGDMALDVDMEPPPIKPSEDAVYVTDDGRSDTVAEAKADIIADVPDDPDEAMAWLEQLAAKQGAAIEELPAIDEPEAVDEGEVEEIEADDAVETAVESVKQTVPDEDVDAELPDWLGGDDTDSGIVGETDWLRNLPEVDMETWLSAEEEATMAGPAEEVAIPDTGPLSSPPPPEPEAELDDELFEPVIEPSTGAYSVDEARLATAKEALADGRLDEAITQFKGLVAEGSGMMAIIAELEQAADAHPQLPALFQILGDAYMRNGQLQKALTSYRSALDQM